MTEALSTAEYIDKLQSKSPADVLKMSYGMAIAEERKYVSVRIPEDMKFDSLEILHLTDVQWGHSCCNETKFIEHRDWLLEKPNRFTVFGGDMIDAANLTSKGPPWDNNSRPIEQVYRFCEVSMAMRHRILGYVGGNHERHTTAGLGRSAGSLIASFLKIPYSEGKQYIDLYFGKWNPYRITLWHGAGGSKTAGSKMQVLDRFMKQGIADLYLVGHLHDAMIKPASREVRGIRGKSVALDKFYGGMSSSFLEFFGSYAEIAGLAPSETFMIKVTIWPDGTQRVTV